MSNEVAKPVQIHGRIIMNAIRRLGDSSGTSVAEIKKYLQKEKKIECDAGSIKLYLKNAVDRGSLSILNGKYKVNEQARRRRKRSSSGSPVKRRRRRSGSKRKSSKPAKGGRKRSGSRRRRRSKKSVAAVE